MQEVGHIFLISLFELFGQQGRFPCIVMIVIAHILFFHPKSINENIKQSNIKKVAVKVVFSHGFHITSNGVF